MEDIFLQYVELFDGKDPQIQRKLNHTLRTVLVADRLARAMALDDENVEIARTVALLHDIARFEQWTKYKTFNDQKSVDHGELALDILFKRNMIDAFGINPEYYPIIRFAIGQHNKPRIDTAAAPDGRALMHAQIIRDADKIDIMEQWRTNYNTLEEFTRAKASGLKNGNGIKPEILANVQNRNIGDYRNAVTHADALVCGLSFAYDLNTTEAKRIWRKRRYPLIRYKRTKALLAPEDRKVCLGVAKRIMKDLK